MFNKVSVLSVSGLMCLVGCALSKPSDFDLVAAENKQLEEGGGKTYEAAQHSAQGETGKKGYSAHHANERVRPDIMTRKDIKKSMLRKASGSKKAHQHNDGYYASGHKASHGEKGYHFVDKGSYAKGHDTKGHHNIHKLDEFQKRKEFFDEDHDEAHKEKHGAFEEGKSFKDGGFQQGGHDKKVFFGVQFEAAGKSEKGGHNAEEGGHNKAAGHDQYFKNAEEIANKEAGEIFKEFGESQKDQQ